jgi:hypothetical protein
MRILDRERLRALACDDYQRSVEIYDRFFPGVDGGASLH